MEWKGYLSLGLAVAVLLAMATNRIGAHLVMTGVLIVLLATGVLTASEAFAGFSNPGVITVAAMFVVAAGIHGSGGVDLLVNSVLGRPKSERSEEHTSELQSRGHLVCRLLLEKKKS